MLILSRRKNEVITIGDKVKVCVVEISQGVVRIGIAAPSDVAVHREEIRDAIVAKSGPLPTAEVTGGLPLSHQKRFTPATSLLTTGELKQVVAMLARRDKSVAKKFAQRVGLTVVDLTIS